MILDAVEVGPCAGIRGTALISGDKSISHRLAMLGSVAFGTTTIHNFAESADCHSTLGCLGRLGVQIRQSGTSVAIEGAGFEGLKEPSEVLDAGNSGTTVRLLSGILAGREFASTFAGDESLSRRPMRRIIEPLTLLGASFSARDGNFLPLTVRGAALTGITYQMPYASAQVKSSILLAGLQARGKTRVIEPAPSRNHTELALEAFGAKVSAKDGAIEVESGGRLTGGTFTVPGDMSSAAFLIAAASALPESRLELLGVGVNPTRSGFLDLMTRMGARIEVHPRGSNAKEAVADITVHGAELSGLDVGGDWIPNIIDEIPVLAILGTRTRDGIRIRDASDLRAKESDRIRAVATNLAALGVRVEEFPDGLYVPGMQKIRGGTIDSFGDHRIAMAFAIAALFAESPITIRDGDCVRISFPRFFETLQSLAR